MGGVYKCEWCGALGHKAAICRAQNAFAGACGTCGAYGHVQAVPRCPYARQRNHRGPPNIRWPPPAFAGAGGVRVSGPEGCLPQQGSLVIHGDGGE